MRLLAVLVCSAVLVLPACARKAGDGSRDARAAPVRAPAAVDAAGGAPVAGEPDELVVDPYCGLQLRKSEAAATATYGGVTYYFCLVDHRDALLADPRQALCRLAGADAGPECDARQPGGRR
jgi:YHS domain-containing protein